MSLNTLKWAAIICSVVAMAVLLGGGIVMKKDLPPYPGKGVGPDGKVLFEKANIIAGQDVYQRYGLMDQGAVWGHGSQRGPEFSAASLKLIANAIGDYYARQDYGKSYKTLMIFKKDSPMSKLPTRPSPIAYILIRSIYRISVVIGQINGYLQGVLLCGGIAMKLAVPSKQTAVDPVCGMPVDPCKTELTADYEDKRVYFCAEGCLAAFEKNPAKYIHAIPAKKKGIWGRYLDKLSKSTDGKAMKCH